jgi:hypothetical protein
MTVLAALATLDADQHARRVDIADLERHHLRDAQPRSVGRAECCRARLPGQPCRAPEPASAQGDVGGRAVSHHCTWRPRRACADCGHWRIAYNSCRNRHCPRC